ncbi:hypothetical protein ACVWZR_006157 [Bradyrhizobium sp. i1.3.1]
MLMKRSTLSGTSPVACAESMAMTRLIRMFSLAAISEITTEHSPPMEWPISTIGAGFSL